MDHRIYTGLSILIGICGIPSLLAFLAAWWMRGRVDRRGWRSFIPGSIRDALADISLREPKIKSNQSELEPKEKTNGT